MSLYLRMFIFWDDLLKQKISNQKTSVSWFLFFDNFVGNQLAVTDLSVVFCVIDNLENGFKGNAAKFQTIDIDISYEVKSRIDRVETQDRNS